MQLRERDFFLLESCAAEESEIFVYWKAVQLRGVSFCLLESCAAEGSEIFGYLKALQLRGVRCRGHERLNFVGRANPGTRVVFS